MTQAPSFTSSSSRSEPRRSVRDLLWFAGGVVAVLVAFELVVATLFSMPPDARQPQGTLERYFSYGYSIEAKLRRAVGKPGQQPVNIVRAGWGPSELYTPPDSWQDSDTRIVFYGMSFTNHIAEQFELLSPDVSIVTRAGPAAPLNHSYMLFEMDPWRGEADHVVVGILSSSLPYMQGLSGLGFMPESPAPYTFPKFEIQDGQLHRVDPVITNLDDFARTFRANSDRWQEHLRRLAAHDDYWDSLTVRASLADQSALARLARRAWASRTIDRATARAFDQKAGYNTQNESMQAVPVLLKKMHEECRRHGQQFIVLLLHAQGEPGHLDKWLTKDLTETGITVISTTDIFSSTDAINFEADGHYLPERDRQIARSVADALRPSSRRPN